MMLQSVNKANGFTPMPHQREAIDKTLMYFRNNRRGKIIKPCGSGKSLTSFWITVGMDVQRTIIAVPNLILQSQMFSTFYNGLSSTHNFICIGSDEEVRKEETDILVTTEEREIRTFLSANEKHNIVIIVTYQSLGLVSDICREMNFPLDLAIIDEAHRTVGTSNKAFSNILFDDYLPIRWRLFMTATEKIYSGRKDEIIGMNNKEYYGETIYEYKLSQAINDGVLCDYQVATLISGSQEVRDFIEQNPYIDYDDIELEEEEKQTLIVTLLATIQAIRERHCRKIITYHNTIIKAQIFKSILDKVIANNLFGIQTFHVNGHQNGKERFGNIGDFEKSFVGILTNSRALVEGINIPAVDCIIFSDKKESPVEIVQAVGRSLRKHQGKPESSIIIPILTDQDNEVENTEYAGLYSILMSLSLQDERIVHEIKGIGIGRIGEKRILIYSLNINDAIKEKIYGIINKTHLRVTDKLLYNPAGYWTKDRCIEEAKKHETRRDWRIKSVTSYEKAKKNCWMNECCKHMMERARVTKDHCIEDAKKYKTRKEWAIKSVTLYERAEKNGWILECCKHMENGGRTRVYWTKLLCVEDAKKYRTKSEWQRSSSSAYQRARKNGWFEECCKHMDQTKKHHYWTKERCIKAAKECKTRKEFIKRFGSAFGAARKGGWIEECCKHMERLLKPIGYWTKDRCIEDAKKYKSRAEWKKLSQSYAAAQKSGWIDECSKHMEKQEKWNKEKCIKVAKECRTKTELKNSFPGAHRYATRNGLLDDLCKYMKK